MLNKLKFWNGSEIFKKLLTGMCRCKSRYKLQKKLQMSENNTPINNNSHPQILSTDGCTYSFIPTLICGQSRTRPEGSIHNYVPQPTGPILTHWNHFRYPNMNYYPFYSNFYSFPFFNTGVQNNLYGRYFHRQLGNIERRKSDPGKRNGDIIMSLRLWEKIHEKPSNKPGFFFTLMSYNILAQDLLEQHPHLYQETSKESLGWETRWKKLFKEISSFSPDILCLQEVQESHLVDYFSLLETSGYKGIFKKRTGSQSDGCAIYYKTDNVTLIENAFVEYFQPSVTLLNRDNIGVLAKFAPKLHPTREFVVATTHLLYNPKRNDVRMAQMQLLLTEIEKMSYSARKENSFYLPVLLTGDLNSSPESDLYEFITKGELKYENLSPRLLEKDPDGLSGRVLVTYRLGITDNCQRAELLERRQKNDLHTIEEKCDAAATNSEIIDNTKVNLAKKCEEGREVLSHSFHFKSVYSHGKPLMNEGTTYQDEWLTVDYIFYSMNNEKNEDKLKLISRYRLPTKDELRQVRIPNKHLGSDHLSLVAKFKLEF